MRKLIAILDNPTANPPGHTIKEARAPYVPVASIPCHPKCSQKVQEERRKLALCMAAGPDLLATLHMVYESLCKKRGYTQSTTVIKIKIRAAIAKAEGK